MSDYLNNLLTTQGIYRIIESLRLEKTSKIIKSNIFRFVKRKRKAEFLSIIYKVNTFRNFFIAIFVV